MSAQPDYATHLRAERGGQAAPIDLPPARRMSPAEIPLTLSADVLRLPYEPAVRLVLAEVVSLYAATGCCDASDAHFAARLTISKDTVNRAVKQLDAEGLLVKVVDKRAGFYRTLTPIAAAIAAKSHTNPYPQSAASYPQSAGSPSRRLPATYPQSAGSPSRNMPVALAADCGTNTPSNIPDNFQGIADDAACAAGAGEAEKKIGLEESPSPSLADPNASATHTEGGAANVATAVPWVEEPAPSARPVLMRDSPLADFGAFTRAWEAATAKYPDTYAAYAQADLGHYHDALLAWSESGGKKKHCWLATIRNSMRNDAQGKGLVKRGPAGAPASSPILKRLATAEAAFALNEYDANGNRIN